MSSSVLTIESWNPTEIKYGIPKKSKVGKSINIVSSKTNKFLEVSMPRLMTWGISDFYDKDKDVHDGKFSITLAFPMKEQETDKTIMALEKMEAMQKQILADACKNKSTWFDHMDEPADEVIKSNMYKFVKYPKNKDTKKIDYNKPPSISAKVECWEGNWKPRIFDTKKQLLFPSPLLENEGMTPADFVPKLSNVSCSIECAGIWIGEKGWGVTWRLKQCVVKPADSMSNSDICQVEFDDEDANNIQNQKVSCGDDVDIDPETATIYKSGIPVDSGVSSAPVPASGSKEELTKVEDTDDETEPVVETPAPVVKAPIKKIIKKPKA
jgi:hypothetical protein